jgi:mRNA interferase RelE/StbE
VSWDYKLEENAIRQLKKLGPQASRKLITYLEAKLCVSEDPSIFGKPLRGKLAGLWRYRVGDLRMICTFENQRLIILVLKAGHRKDVYE